MPFAPSSPTYRLSTHGRLVLRLEGLLGVMSVAELAERYGMKRQSVRHLLRPFDRDEPDILKRVMANLPTLHGLWERDARASGVTATWAEALPAAITEAQQEPLHIIKTALERLTKIDATAVALTLPDDLQPAEAVYGASRS